MNERLPPIPTPRAQLLRQLRLQYLPLVVFLLGLAAAAVIWTRWVAPPTLVAEAETIRAEVRSTLAGTLTGLAVELLQPVKAGQRLGEVVINDPGFVEASLAVLRAEIDLIRTTMDPVLSQQRTRLDFERLQLDWMSERVKLASLQVQLQLAESNLARTTPLLRNNLVTEERFDELKSLRDSLAAQFKAQTELIERLEPGIRNFSTTVATPEQGLQAAIKLQEQKLRLTEVQLQPRPLLAPVDGVLTAIYRRSGEAVAAGEPILQISATRSERIVGFMRQPLRTAPRIGAEVEIRTRTLRRQIARAAIAHVGQQLEPITPTLLAAMRLPVSEFQTELGLRVHVTMPAGFTIRPGEHVDVIILDE